MAPDSDELRFWAGLGMAQAGELHAGAELVRAVIEAAPAWRELLGRLEPEIAPSARDVLDAL